MLEVVAGVQGEMRLLLAALLCLTGCTTQSALVQICAIQPLGQSQGIVVARMSCEPEGTRI